ncbi:MAG: translation initiation factor IF-2 N-terminal domain-containing protein, partial [Planctomycetota bacterium]|nr:translation initiation factor IF-2 N-terminal domain-containing protein [Planctomycetota bacterium]
MAKARRVFEIAKELGIESKSIVDKCSAEGVPGIVNHMSTVKIGLEHSIKEWFSESHSITTTVETAEKVDPTKVARKSARRRAGEVDGHTAVAEPPAAESRTSAPAAPAAPAPEGAPAAPAAPAEPAPVVAAPAAPVAPPAPPAA